MGIEIFDKEALLEARMRRPARRQRRERRGAAHDKLHWPSGSRGIAGEGAHLGSSVKGSCTMRAASISSRPAT